MEGTWRWAAAMDVANMCTRSPPPVAAQPAATASVWWLSWMGRQGTLWQFEWCAPWAPVDGVSSPTCGARCCAVGMEAAAWGSAVAAGTVGN